MATDQLSFYDEHLKKQIQGYFISTGWEIQVGSVYGHKSIRYNELGPSIDHDAQVSAAKKVLSAMASDAAKDSKGH